MLILESYIHLQFPVVYCTWINNLGRAAIGNNQPSQCVLSQAYFSHPMVATAVIIHLAADGTTIFDSVQHQKQCNISVQLVDTKGKNHSLGV